MRTYALFVLMPALMIACVVIVTCPMQTIRAASPQRFERVGMSRFDENTYIDIVRDSHTNTCSAVYFRTQYDASGVAVIGEVPCR